MYFSRKVGVHSDIPESAGLFDKMKLHYERTSFGVRVFSILSSELSFVLYFFCHHSAPQYREKTKKTMTVQLARHYNIPTVHSIREKLWENHLAMRPLHLNVLNVCDYTFPVLYRQNAPAFFGLRYLQNRDDLSLRFLTSALHDGETYFSTCSIRLSAKRSGRTNLHEFDQHVNCAFYP